MRNQKAPRKSCAQRCMCSRRSSGPAQHCAPGCFLAQGCFYSLWIRTEHSSERSSGQAALRNICFTLHTERQGAQRDTSQGPVFARTLFVHWEDVFGGGVQRWLHSAHGHSVGKHRHGTKPCLQLRPRLNSLCSGCQESAIFRHEKCWITLFLLTLCWSEGCLGAPQVHSCSGWTACSRTIVHTYHLLRVGTRMPWGCRPVCTRTALHGWCVVPRQSRLPLTCLGGALQAPMCVLGPRW